MVTKGAFGTHLMGCYGSCDTEVGISGDIVTLVLLIAVAVPCEGSSEGDLGHAFREGEDGSKGMGRGASYKNGDAHGEVFVDSFLMVDADAAMELVVEAHLFIGAVVVTLQLDAVHSRITL